MTIRNPREKSKNSHERIFVFLLFGCWFCLTLGGYFFWKLTYLGFYQIHPILPNIIGFILAGFLVLIGIGILLFLKILLLERYTWFFSPIRRLVSRYLFPLMMLVGRIFRISEENIQLSFIDINNHLVQIKGISVKPEKIMILLPQCLQNSDCAFRITKDIRSCKRCGHCQIAEIISLLESYGIMGWVATGGTLARKHIVDYRPDAVIAVACPRDLSSGIIDCFPIPVYGILNQRPEGPCVNTLVNMEKVRWAIKNFVIR